MGRSSVGIFYENPLWGPSLRALLWGASMGVAYWDREMFYGDPLWGSSVGILYGKRLW